MSRQTQFLNVIDRDLAQERFEAALDLQPLPSEQVPISQALGRILAEDVVSPGNVPAFDRSNFDGFAVRAAETFGADENYPLTLRLREETIPAGSCPDFELQPGECVSIATGGMLPRGANAICLIEQTRRTEKPGSDSLTVAILRSVFPGSGVSYTGSDIVAGQVILHAGDNVTSRETGVLAAVGLIEIPVVRRPKVAVISTGDEIIPPGESIRPGQVYDSNARIISDAVAELGGEPKAMGIAVDDFQQLEAIVKQAFQIADVVLLSGGTSKGEGDISYRVVSQFSDPGIVAHGVALKPGKPICLAASQGKPIVILPGFPTSAIFTFHEFVAPVIRRLAGHPPASPSTVEATLATKANSEIGRTEYLLVGLSAALAPRSSPNESMSQSNCRAFPMGKGSGSVTTFSHADGFITIDRQTELLEAGAPVKVQLISPHVRVADLVFIGSHCPGVDLLLGALRRQGFQAKYLTVGSMGGLKAARNGDCDVAGIHLFDTVSKKYNVPFISEGVRLFTGYQRRQGVVFRANDRRFSIAEPPENLIRNAAGQAELMMINRNQGSGTRILIDRLLAKAPGDETADAPSPLPNGYENPVSSHSAVCSAICQGRADWGVAIESAIPRDPKGEEPLAFLPLENECFDFLVPADRTQRPAVQAMLELLRSEKIRDRLRALGFVVDDNAGRQN